MSDEDRAPRLKAQRKQWTPVGSSTYKTMAETRIALKGMEGAKWKWAKPPGNGHGTSVFQCNAHKECARLLKAQLCDDGYVIMGAGEHGTEVNDKKRKNSTLSFEMEAEVRKSMDQGGRPAGLRVALTKEKVSELKSAGLDPNEHKMDGGGLKGALPSLSSPADCGILRDTCSPHVSTCILHVFCMHPKCIPNVSDTLCPDTCTLLYPIVC
jgi:hypothetical protein